MLFVTDIDKHNFALSQTDLTGKVRKYKYGEIPLLPKDRELVVSFDQSTKQTGIAIGLPKGIPFMMLDIINRDKDIMNDTYMGMMQVTLTEMFKGTKVSLILIEKPFHGENTHTFKVLAKLRTFLKSLNKIIPSWEDAEIVEVFPQSWKSAFLTDPKYKGRFRRDKVKEAIREEVMDRYEWTHRYLTESKNPPDSCDAVGLMVGYFHMNFRDGKVSEFRKINTTMEEGYRHEVYNWMEVFNREVDLDEQIANKPDTFKNLCFVYGIELFEFNPDLTVESNIRRATNITNSICLIFIRDEGESLVQMWEQEHLLMNDEVFVIVAKRKHRKEGLPGGENAWNKYTDWKIETSS